MTGPTATGSLLLAASVFPVSVAGWLSLLGLIALGFIVWRGGGGKAIDILQKANHTLVEALKEKEREVGEKNARILELENTHTLEPLIERVSQHDQRAAQLLATHEERAIERHQQQLIAGQKMLLLLDMIAERLGPDGNGHDKQERT